MLSGLGHGLITVTLKSRKKNDHTKKIERTEVAC